MTYSSLIILYIADSFGNAVSSINLITNLEVGTILQFKFYSRIWRNVKKYVFAFFFFFWHRMDGNLIIILNEANWY